MVIFGESNSGGMGARKGGHVLTSSMWGESADDQTTGRDRVGNGAAVHWDGAGVVFK